MSDHDIEYETTDTVVIAHKLSISNPPSKGAFMSPALSHLFLNRWNKGYDASGECIYIL